MSRCGQLADRLAVQSFGTFARKLAGNLFTVLFPSDCRICDTPLVGISRLPICPECLAGILPIDGTLCSACGERIFSPFVGESTEPRCGFCRRVEPVFTRAVAYGSYESGLRELIHLLKFTGVRPAADVLGRMLSQAIAKLEPGLPPGELLVIPVPLFRAKRRQRRFNQAELIASCAIKAGNNGQRLCLCTDVLIRKRETVSQIGLTSHQRRENLRGAFQVVDREIIRDREVLLVDDVYTTGSTVSECSQVLRRAGAKRIWVATVARTLKVSAQGLKVGSVGAGASAEELLNRSALARAVG